ncbi:MAG: sigma-54-dependent transcriptional regulator [Thermosulfidibacteraceae bacterium]
MKGYVVVVDDESEVLSTVREVLEDEGYITEGALTGSEAISVIERKLPDLVILDIWLPDRDGLEILERIKSVHPDLPILIISGHGTIETAVKAVKLGAFDFLEKPLDLEKLLLKVEKAIEEGRIKLEVKELRTKLSEDRELIGVSDAIKRLRETIELVAPTDCWVLIYGESGSGKEIVARMIHELSPRKDKPFVEVNCAAIPMDRIEYELFGWERGACNLSSEGKRGKFELANGGTIYFDEVGDMSLSVQAKVLRVLEELKIERIGGTYPIEIDIRVISSTNKNLEEEVTKGNFRKDLYYRLNVFPIYVPPLRERKEDIPHLARYFIRKFSTKYRRVVEDISEGALKVLANYEWPGNVRELRNLMERLVITVNKKVIEEKDLPFPLGSSFPSERVISLKEAKEFFEREYILKLLKKNNWNISRTAEELGIERTHLYRKLRSYGIRRGGDEV